MIDGPNSGEAAFYRNPMPDHVLFGMSRTDLRARRRAHIDTARSQRRSILNARAALRLDPQMLEKLGTASRQVAVSGKSMTEATRGVAAAARSMMRAGKK